MIFPVINLNRLDALILVWSIVIALTRSSTQSDMLACGYNDDNYGTCVTCNTGGSDSEYFFSNFGKKVAQSLCQTPIKTFSKNIVFDASQGEHFLVIGLQAEFTTIQHTKEVLVKVDFNCPKDGSCKQSEYFVIYLPDLMPSHAYVLESMQIYLPLPSIDIDSYEHLMVNSHSKDACDGHYTQYMVEVNRDQIESVFLIEASLEFCDGKTVVRSNVSSVSTSVAPSTTASTVPAVSSRNRVSTWSSGVIIACFVIILILAFCSALAIAFYIRHRKTEVDNGMPMAPINNANHGPSNSNGQVYVSTGDAAGRNIASTANESNVDPRERSSDSHPPEQVIRIESPHPDDAFLFEWPAGGQDRLETPRDSFYAPMDQPDESVDEVPTTSQGPGESSRWEDASDLGAAQQ